MKTFKRVLIIFLLLIIVAVAGVYFYVAQVGKRALPDYNKDIELIGLSNEVQIFRDQYAVPHIYAKTESDLYRTVGYVMAQERLWQMDLMRRLTMGRLSEIFGDAMVDVDLLMRALRIPEKSELVLKENEYQINELITAFADGVNQYIEQNKDKLPPEFTILGYEPEKWTAAHSLNLIGYLSWDLTMSYRAEIILHKVFQRIGEEKTKFLLPDIQKHSTEVFPSLNIGIDTTVFDEGLLSATKEIDKLGLEVFRASNNWAVSGKIASSGKPMLSNDMHLNIKRVPGIWMQMHLVSESGVNVTGVAVPGAPFIISGHNDSIAWGMTNVMLDDADFYVESINPDNRNQYRFNGKWRDMDVRTEKIYTSTRTDAEFVERELRFTHRGPVISSFRNLKNSDVSMRWIGNEYSNEVRSVYLLSKAGNWSDFKNAMKTFSATSQNVVYADVDGNIGLYTCAGVPIRKGAKILFVPGDTDEYDWKGFVPFDSLPHVYNPPEEFVSSANNKIAPDDYPYYISKWYDLPYRIERIREMLNTNEKIDKEKFKKILTDVNSKLVQKFIGQIVEILSKVETLSDTEQKALNLLQNWNAELLKESTATSVFERFYYDFLNELLLDELGNELYNEFFSDKILVRNTFERAFEKHDNPFTDNINTDKKESFSDITVAAFKKSVKWLTDNYGTDINEWQWGKMHTITYTHPLASRDDVLSKVLNKLFGLNKGPIPLPGSFHTVCPYAYSYSNFGDVNHGASQRHIYMLSDFDESESVIASGMSGIPASPHYCGQVDLYTQGEFHPDYFSRKKVEKNAKHKATVRIKK